MPARSRPALVLLVALGLAACGRGTAQPDANSTVPPTQDSCRVLVPADLVQSANASPVVPCTARHTAQTYAVGSFPASLSSSGDPDDKRLGGYLYP
ncbi:MAG: hypothetical protein ACRDPI_02750, partial [Nocardioidaceae bacterium]